MPGVRTEARFPGIGQSAGHYESFYLKASRPGGGQGIWIRHTIHKRPDEELTGSVWFTLFDADATGPRATKLTVDLLDQNDQPVKDTGNSANAAAAPACAQVVVPKQ